MIMDTEKNVLPEENEDVLTPQEPEEEAAEVTEASSDTTEPTEEAAEEVAEETADEPNEAEEDAPTPPAEEAVEETDSQAEETSEAEDEEEFEEESEEDILKRNRRRKRWRGVLRFWITLLALSLCVLILLCCASIPFRSLLEQYEASQYKYYRDSVYEMLFEDPDWALLYDLAGVESTEYEGKNAFVEYMEEKVGDQELTWTETSTGLSDSHRFLLRCGGETVAAFTIDQTDADGALLPSWTLTGVEVFFERTESVTIQTLPDYTVYVNGIALDESHITTTVHTVAEDHLPEGVHSYRWVELQAGDFLVEPDVVILDENNNPVTVYYAEQTDLYSTDIPVSPEITEEEYSIVTEAAKARALFDIRAINISQLRQYFDSTTQIYTDISDADPFVKSYRSYTIDEESLAVTDFCRYSDDLFSAKVSVSMEIKVKWKTYKTYERTATYFFTRSGSGAYLVTSETEADLLKQIKQVHLTYMMNDTVLLSEMLDSGTTVFHAPEAANAEGSQPSAWGKLEEDGSITVVLEVSSDGSFVLAEGQSLEPMTLYPLYISTVTEE